MDPGGTIDTKGTYVQLSAATIAPIRFLNVSVGNRDNATMTTCVWRLDIAIGGAGSEQVIIPNLLFGVHASGDTIDPTTYSFPVDIPAGVRLAARTDCSINDATDRLIDVCTYGVG